jgi:hypothetical protein
MIMFSLQTQDKIQREFKARVAFATALRLFFRNTLQRLCSRRKLLGAQNVYDFGCFHHPG